METVSRPSSLEELYKAPPGKFRVTEIDYDQMEYSIFEGDYTAVIGDCNTLEEAQMVIKDLTRKNVERIIYDEQGKECGSFAVTP